MNKSADPNKNKTSSHKIDKLTKSERLDYARSLLRLEKAKRGFVLRKPSPLKAIAILAMLVGTSPKWGGYSISHRGFRFYFLIFIILDLFLLQTKLRERALYPVVSGIIYAFFFAAFISLFT